MISTAREGSVLVVTWDDGENRFTPEALDGWAAALDEVDADTGLTALVSTGTGKFFSNGLDVAVLGSDGADGYLDRVCGLLARLLAAPVTTVAAVNGHAFGAGAMLALAHDVRVQRQDRGYVCLPEVDLGLPFLPFMSALVRSKLSPRTAQDAMTAGLRYGGDLAVAEGLAHEAHPEPDVRRRALELAGERGGKDRTALTAIKVDVYAEVLATRP